MTHEIIHGDCLEVMRTMPDGSVDAVVTDPPYNVGFSYSGDADGDRRGDYAEWCHSWWAECRRIARRTVVVSCGIANIPVWATAPDPPDWWLVWWKPAAMGGCSVGFNNWEPIAFWGKVSRIGCDVVRAGIVPDPSLIGHPCPKPLDWAVKLIEMTTPPGGTVLDPFVGSGTTLVACQNTGRVGIGIEREAEYVAIARARIAGANADSPLFTA